MNKLPLDYERPSNRPPERPFWKEFLSLPKWRWSGGTAVPLHPISSHTLAQELPRRSAA
jgi:hypothetical protein